MRKLRLVTKPSKSLAPEYLANLLDHSKCIMVKNGIDAESAKKIAHDICEQMCAEWGGQNIYFPYGLRMKLSERDHKIYSEFKGDNHAELARKHKTTLQSIYRIIAHVRSEEIARRQGSLDL